MKTKIILVVAVLVFLYSACNPPWRIVVKDSKGHTKRTELVWSYLGDSPRAGNEYYQAANIAVDVFLLQSLCILVSAAASFWLVSNRPPSSIQQSSNPSPAQRAQVAADLAALPGAAEDLQTINPPPSTLN